MAQAARLGHAEILPDRHSPAGEMQQLLTYEYRFASKVHHLELAWQDPDMLSMHFLDTPSHMQIHYRDQESYPVRMRILELLHQ
jgi:hypothetical protein